MSKNATTTKLHPLTARVPLDMLQAVRLAAVTKQITQQEIVQQAIAAWIDANK